MDSRILRAEQSKPADPDPVASAPRLSFWEKTGYALGDSAANFIFQTMIMFQLAFYTDAFGISAAAAASLLAAVRFWDAIFDPIVGIMADRTETKWGKFRPWILWTALPFGIMSFLTFSTPAFGASGKLAYAYATYIGLMMVYSANNVPYSALSGVMTHDLAERTSLSSYRFVFAMFAQLAIQGLAFPMVRYFGRGNTAHGYQATMAIFSSLAVGFCLIAFLSTKERIHPAPDQDSSIRRDLTALVDSRPWRAMFLLTIVLFVALAMRGSIIIYYFKYYVRREDLFSTFNILGTLASILGIAWSRRMAVAYGKKSVFVGGLALTALFTACFAVLPPTSLKLIFALEVARQFVYGLTIPVLWAAMGDVADYSEWRSERRATGMIFSGIVFGLKAGLGFGGALTSYVLSRSGYVPNAVQSTRALEGIRLAMSLFPAAVFGICVICLYFYPITRQLEIQMSRDLALRRRNRPLLN